MRAILLVFRIVNKGTNETPILGSQVQIISVLYQQDFTDPKKGFNFSRFKEIITVRKLTINKVDSTEPINTYLVINFIVIIMPSSIRMIGVNDPIIFTETISYFAENTNIRIIVTIIIIVVTTNIKTRNVIKSVIPFVLCFRS